MMGNLAKSKNAKSTQPTADTLYYDLDNLGWTMGTTLYTSLFRLAGDDYDKVVVGAFYSELDVKQWLSQQDTPKTVSQTKRSKNATVATKKEEDE